MIELNSFRKKARMPGQFFIISALIESCKNRGVEIFHFIEI